MPFDGRPWFRRILLASTVLWLVLGAGLWARFDSRPSPLPERMVVAAGVVDRSGRVFAWVESPFPARADQDDIRREIETVDAYASALGLKFEPVRFLLNYENPQRYMVTARRIELGSALAEARGQVRHAYLKSWALQNTRAELAAAVFRRDVIADLFLSIADGGLALGMPGERGEFGYEDPSTTTFFEQLAAFGRVCRSPWKTNDLLGICEGVRSSRLPVVEETSPFSVRRAVGEAVWRSIEPLNAFERVEFAKAWAGYLTASDQSGDAVLIPEASSLLAWHEWARGEVETLLPPASERLMLAPRLAARIAAHRPEALKRVGLDRREWFKLDIAAKFESAEAVADFEASVFRQKETFARLAARTAIVNLNDEFLLLPGGVRLEPRDLARIRSRAVIWDACKAPSVRDILGFPIATDRALVVENCGREEGVARYRSFIRYGVEGFALDNPDRKFVQVHRPSLEFAMERGWLRARDFIGGLIGQNPPRPSGDRKLGLAEADWNPQMKAFRVLGVVEAVEWFRPSMPPERAGRSASGP